MCLTQAMLLFLFSTLGQVYKIILSIYFVLKKVTVFRMLLSKVYHVSPLQWKVQISCSKEQGIYPEYICKDNIGCRLPIIVKISVNCATLTKSSISHQYQTFCFCFCFRLLQLSDVSFVNLWTCSIRCHCKNCRFLHASVLLRATMTISTFIPWLYFCKSDSRTNFFVAFSHFVNLHQIFKWILINIFTLENIWIVNKEAHHSIISNISVNVILHQMPSSVSKCSSC